MTKRSPRADRPSSQSVNEYDKPGDQNGDPGAEDEVGKWRRARIQNRDRVFARIVRDRDRLTRPQLVLVNQAKQRRRTRLVQRAAAEGLSVYDVVVVDYGHLLFFDHRARYHRDELADRRELILVGANAPNRARPTETGMRAHGTWQKTNQRDDPDTDQVEREGKVGRMDVDGKGVWHTSTSVRRQFRRRGTPRQHVDLFQRFDVRLPVRCA